MVHHIYFLEHIFNFLLPFGFLGGNVILIIKLFLIRK